MTPRWSKDPRIMSLVGTTQISNQMALSKIHQISDRLRSKRQLNFETIRTVIADELFDRRGGIPFLTAFCLLPPRGSMVLSQEVGTASIVAVTK